MSYSQKPSDAAWAVSNDAYTFDYVDVDYVAGMKSGSVLTAAGVWVAAGAEGNAVYVLCDPDADYAELADDTYTMRVAARDAFCNKQFLNFADAANAATAQAALLAKGIKPVDSAA